VLVQLEYLERRGCTGAGPSGENTMLTFSLQSGSNGNCIYVEVQGVGLLFDAGISGRRARDRLAEKGRDIRRVAAVVVSHEHSDHIRCAGIYQRLFGLPIYVARTTLANTRCDLGRLEDVHHFRSGQCLDFGPLKVHTIHTAHDAADPVAFVVEADGRRLGILTDLGYPFPVLQELLEQLDAAYLESNYDPQMLREGPYPRNVKAWIRGPGGHLSNHESAQLARSGAANRLQWLALAHLSQSNNDPDLALATHRQAVGTSFPIYSALRYGPCECLTVA